MISNKAFVLILVYVLLFFPKISWAQISTTTVHQFYCPLSEILIVEDFSITDPTNTLISTLYIQISTGYINGEDLLSLNNPGSHPNISVDPFNSSQGKLTLHWTGSGVTNYADLIAAVKSVVFQSSDPNVSGTRTFSITIDEISYLALTDHYYEYFPDIGITWTAANGKADIKSYWGRQGYLATITSYEEAVLVGKQAPGAGWIGGSDAETEGVWKWVTGPENGTIFWNGAVSGSSPNFAFWNTGEPNQSGDEDYAHITAANVGIQGSWNDLSNEGAANNNYGYQPQGYIVEYGKPGDLPLSTSVSTEITIAKITSTTPNSNCGPGTVTLSATSSTGTVLWFIQPNGGSPIHTGNDYTTNLLATTNFFVQASDVNCRTPITATINTLPSIQPAVTLKNCDEDGTPNGFTDFNLSEADSYITNGDASLSVTYYKSYYLADDGTTTPLNPSPFNNQNAINNKVYARVENTFGCHSVSTVTLEVTVSSLPSNYVYRFAECDDDNLNDGLKVFDLTKATDEIKNELSLNPNLTFHYYKTFDDAHLENNEILPQNAYKNESEPEQNLFVRIEDNNDCYGIGENLTLIVNPRPEFEIEAIPNDVVCLNLSNTITLTPFNEQGNYTYEWFDEDNNRIGNNPTIEVSKGGIYTAIATLGLTCRSFSKTITVTESNVATINLNDITITDDSDNNSITINTSNLGIGDYEFAIKKMDEFISNYKPEAIFEDVTPGIHTIYIQDKKGCGISTIEVSVIGFPKFFTPNNDGYNDTWQIKGVSDTFYPTSLIYIFDRFGKLLTQIDPKSDGWNGFFNGKMLPATDYWFSAQLIDENGTIREKKGHFSLITR